MSEQQSQQNLGREHGPRYPGNEYWHDLDRIPTNYGVVRIDREDIVRKWNGAEQEVLESRFEATCPCCYTKHEVEGGSDGDRSELYDLIVDCCDEVRLLYPSDWIDCDVCNREHRERHECTPPAYRDPFPDTDEPAECTDCDFAVDALEDIGTHDGSCPECDSRSVRVGVVSDD